MDVSSSTALRRRWLSLVTGPWHTSSRVVAVLVLAFLVFCNIPGQLASAIHWKEGSIFAAHSSHSEHLEHGWPLTYLVRVPKYHFAGVVALESCWEVWRDTREFHGYVAVANAVAITILSYGLAALFEWWRRGRRRIWQFHLRDLALGLAAICAVGAWYAAARHDRSQAEVSLAKSHGPEAILEGVHPYIRGWTSKHSGVTWLRLLTGDRLFEPLDPFVRLTVNSPGLDACGKISSVKALLVLSSPARTREDLRRLEKFPNLEHLHIRTFQPTFDPQTVTTNRDSQPRVELPPLPRLRVLAIDECRFRLTGLSKLRSLEAIGLDSCQVDEPMLREMSMLSRLTAIEIWGGHVELQGLIHLQALTQLERIVLLGVPLKDDWVRQLGSLSQVKELELLHVRIEPDGFRYLAGMQGLRSLTVSGQCCDDAAVSYLQLPPKVRDLSLWDTSITCAAIPILSQWTQLETLRLPEGAFTTQDVARLSAALPNCRVSTQKALTVVY